MPLVRLQMLPREIALFYYAYDEVKTADTATNFKAITHRCRMVKLFHLYYKAESVYIEGEPPLLHGQTQTAQRKQLLFNLLYSRYEGIKDVAKNEASKLDWNAFAKRLSAATRWNTILQELGYGVLGLIPKELVPNT